MARLVEEESAPGEISNCELATGLGKLTETDHDCLLLVYWDDLGAGTGGPGAGLLASDDRDPALAGSAPPSGQARTGKGWRPMTSDLGERLRRANPRPRTEPPAVADEELLQRLLAEPRMRLDRAGRRLRGGRAAVLIAAAVLLLGGLAAAASRLAIDYFGTDDREPTPAEVVAAFQLMADGVVDAERYVRVAAFDGPDGRVTIYAARSRDGATFCAANYISDGTKSGSGCSERSPEEAIPWIALGGTGFGHRLIAAGRLCGLFGGEYPSGW